MLSPFKPSQYASGLFFTLEEGSKKRPLNTKIDRVTFVVPLNKGGYALPEEPFFEQREPNDYREETISNFI